MEMPRLATRREAMRGQRERYMRSRWGLQGVVCFAINAALTIVLATLGVATAKDKVAKDQRGGPENRNPSRTRR